MEVVVQEDLNLTKIVTFASVALLFKEPGHPFIEKKGQGQPNSSDEDGQPSVYAKQVLLEHPVNKQKILLVPAPFP